MYEEVIRLIERAGVAFPPLGNGVSQAAIENAETVLGIALPNSYKWWLLNYGGGQIQADIVYGLDEDGMGRPDLIELAHMNEQDGCMVVSGLYSAWGTRRTSYSTQRTSTKTGNTRSCSMRFREGKKFRTLPASQSFYRGESQKSVARDRLSASCCGS